MGYGDAKDALVNGVSDADKGALIDLGIGRERKASERATAVKDGGTEIFKSARQANLAEGRAAAKGGNLDFSQRFRERKLGDAVATVKRIADDCARSV